MSDTSVCAEADAFASFGLLAGQLGTVAPVSGTVAIGASAHRLANATATSRDIEAMDIDNVALLVGPSTRERRTRGFLDPTRDNTVFVIDFQDDAGQCACGVQLEVDEFQIEVCFLTNHLQNTCLMFVVLTHLTP